MFYAPYLRRPAILTERETAMYFPQTPDGEGSPAQTGYFMDAHSLYASPHVQGTHVSNMSARAPSPYYPPALMASPLMTDDSYPDARPAKRSRKSAGNDHPAGRMQGACTRCKRLKVSGPRVE